MSYLFRLLDHAIITSQRPVTRTMITIDPDSSRLVGSNAPTYENFLKYLLEEMGNKVGIPMSVLYSRTGSFNGSLWFNPICCVCERQVDKVEVFEQLSKRCHAIYFHCHKSTFVIEVPTSQLIDGIGEFISRCRPFITADPGGKAVAIVQSYMEELAMGERAEQKVRAITEQRDRAMKLVEDLADRIRNLENPPKPKTYSIKPRTISLTD